MLALGGVALSIAAYLWGYQTHQNRIFPYRLIYQNLTTRRVEAPAQRVRTDALTNLPYLASAPDPHGNESGVLIQEPEKAFEGYTLYGPRNEGRALLVKMDGEPIFEWSRPEEESWHHIELLDNGDLLVTVKARCIEKPATSSASTKTPNPSGASRNAAFIAV